MEMLGTKENAAVLNKLKQIVMLGRQAGFFLILACQRPDAKYLGDGIRDQFNFRVALGRIRDSLFSIQVKQPWLLLQYGNSDMESVGADRVESLLSTSPDTNNGEDREEIVVEEIEDLENTNLTVTKTINRLGMVFFLFIFNIGISVFVFLLTGILIFSQVLFTREIRLYAKGKGKRRNGGRCDDG